MTSVPPPTPKTASIHPLGGTVPAGKLATGSLRWHESLFIRFAALGLILGLASVLVSAWLVQQSPTKISGDESSRRVGLTFDLITQQAQTLASGIVHLSLNPAEGMTGIRTNVPALINRYADANLLAAVGIWPMPHTLDPTRERASLLWIRDGGGTFQLRADYNDPRIVPYAHEKWFTPSQYSPRDRCYWTPAYSEPLTRREISTCAMPIRGPQGFIGVVTVSLNLDAVAKRLALVSDDSHGYGLLVTQGGEILTTVGMPDTANDHSQNIRNLAELARTQPALNPLALQLHQDHEDAIRSASLDNEQIMALQNQTRDMSREEAESALAMLALTPPAGEIKPSYRKFSRGNDSSSHETAITLFSLPGLWWMLIRVSPGDSLLSGLGQYLSPALLPALSMMVFIVLMLWMLRVRIVNPLRRMTEQMAATASARDVLHHLDDKPRNELGHLAYWHNAGLRHLQQQLEQLRTLHAQHAPEQGERRRPQDAGLKARDSIALALQSVADGVIILNERGHIEEMNLAAERLTGVPLRAATGKAFADVFNALPQKDSKEPLPDLAKIAARLTAPMEYPRGLRLQSTQGETSDIQLSFIPIPARPPSRSAGCITVFRKSGVQTHVSALMKEQRMLDSMTGMPMRGACERHLHDLINQARLEPQQHALLFIDVDDLKRINDAQGHHIGDEVISQIAGILTSIANEDRQAYRLYGDQFAIILQKTDPARARAFAELLCGRFSSSALRGQPSNFRVTISVGIAMADGTSPTPAEIIRRSELACSLAKHAGRNRAQEWAPSQDDSKRQADDALWLKRIRAGLEQDMFHLTTQRIAPMPANAAEGPAYQMLMALEDEEGFWSTANTFMPTAQRHNLAHEMDRWLINRTIAHLQQNRTALERLSFVGIQLSETAISDNSLLEYLVKFFTENPKISAHKFCFGFNEYAMHKNPRQALVFCEVMHNLGCHLDVNGFASRRSSDIALLRKLPVDFIRIDAAQFPNAETDPIELMLTESLMQLARSLGKRIIVKNLETTAQRQAWEKLGPDYLQGSAVAKPSPIIFSGA